METTIYYNLLTYSRQRRTDDYSLNQKNVKLLSLYAICPTPGQIK